MTEYTPEEQLTAADRIEAELERAVALDPSDPDAELAIDSPWGTWRLATDLDPVLWSMDMVTLELHDDFVHDGDTYSYAMMGCLWYDGERSYVAAAQPVNGDGVDYRQAGRDMVEWAERVDLKRIVEDNHDAVRPLVVEKYRAEALDQLEKSRERIRAGETGDHLGGALHWVAELYDFLGETERSSEINDRVYAWVARGSYVPLDVAMKAVDDLLE